MTLPAFLSARRKTAQQSHTHTWFAAGPLRNQTSTLHIERQDVPLLRAELIKDVTNRADLSQGANSVTETRRVTATYLEVSC